MDDVKLKLAHNRVLKQTSMPFCSLGADKNLSVLKRQHVSRSCLPEKLSMSLRHPAIGNQPDENVAQFPQIRLFLFLQLQAILQGFHGELLEPANID